MVAIHAAELARGTPSGIVRRLLQGEPIERLSAETGVPTADLHTWLAVFLEAGGRALDRHAHRTWKRARRQRRAEPAPLFRSDAHGEPDAPRLSAAEHQHQLWITLGLADDD